MDIKATATMHDGTKVSGRLTTDHAASSYGQPVFVDASGHAYDWISIASISTAPQMGSHTSERKTAAARANSQKAGRPRRDGTQGPRQYNAWASNEQGATVSVGIDADHPNGGKIFTSVAAAAAAARRELGPGWRVMIEDAADGAEVQTFTIRGRHV